MAGFIVYWSKDYVKEIEKAGDKGPFRVVYLAKEAARNARNGMPISYEEARILDAWAEEYNVPQHHQAYPGSGEHFPGGNYSDHTHIYNVHVLYSNN